MPVEYAMSWKMYEELRWPQVWNGKLKKMVKSGKPLTEQELLKYINTTFGLLREVTKIKVIGDKS